MVRDKGGRGGALTGPWDVRMRLSQPLFYYYYYLVGEYYEVISQTFTYFYIYI